jgi:hypothetical protein
MSIVVGLGIGRILSGFSALIEARHEVDSDWPTVLWAVNVLGYHLLFWWIVVNNWRFLSEWSFSQFGALFLYGVLIFFCASLILPRQVPKGMDLSERFQSIRRPFFVLWLLVMCSELLDSLLKGTDYVLNELGAPYIAVWSVSVLLSVGGIAVSSRRYHFTAAIAFFVIYAAWTLSAFATI